MTRPPTWGDLLRRATEALGDAVEARWVVERVADVDRAGLLALSDDTAPSRVVPFLDDLLERRAAGEPIQLVLGRWPFRHLELVVDRRALLPRPETEQVVQHALDALPAVLADPRRPGGPPVLADLGTGSGCIALSLATEVPGAEVWAVDASAEALALARSNLAGVGGMAASRVRLARGSWFDALPAELAGRFDLLVTNPPYVGEDERGDLDESVLAWEPHEALFAGPDGLDDLRVLVAGAPRWLARPGLLVAELAPRQADAVLSLAREHGATAEVLPDLAGRPRALVARFD